MLCNESETELCTQLGALFFAISGVQNCIPSYTNALSHLNNRQVSPHFQPLIEELSVVLEQIFLVSAGLMRT